jgi:hypothetical protein
VPWLRPGLASFNPQGHIFSKDSPEGRTCVCMYRKTQRRSVYCFCIKIGELYFPNIFSANKLDILCSVDPNLLCLLNCIFETIQVTAACGPWAVSWPAVAYTLASLSLRRSGFESGARPCKNSGEQNVTETGLFSSNCWFSCQCCCTSAPH